MYCSLISQYHYIIFLNDNIFSIETLFYHHLHFPEIKRYGKFNIFQLVIEYESILVVSWKYQRYNYQGYPNILLKISRQALVSQTIKLLLSAR